MKKQELQRQRQQQEGDEENKSTSSLGIKSVFEIVREPL
jgi:hypothetical protein